MLLGLDLGHVPEHLEPLLGLSLVLQRLYSIINVWRDGSMCTDDVNIHGDRGDSDRGLELLLFLDSLGWRHHSVQPRYCDYGWTMAGRLCCI